MTNEEAINWIKSIISIYISGGDEWFDAKRREALNMAIDALSVHTESDLISRADAINAFDDNICIVGAENAREVRCYISDTTNKFKYLPSVSAERSADEYVRIEVYRDLYEKYIELKHSAERVGEWIKKENDDERNQHTIEHI